MLSSVADQLRGSRTLMADRNFSLLMGGQVVSQIGENLNRVALFWFVYLYSDRVTDMVIVGILQTLPPLLFGWLNGVLLDRHSKKWIMIGVDLARGVLVLLIPLLFFFHLLSLPLLYVLVFVIATMSGVFGPALYSAIPLIVEKPLLLSANALMQTTGQIGLLAGPLLGGVLAALWNPSGEMAINAATFFASAAFLLFMKVPETPSRARGFHGRGIAAEVREGIRFVFDPCQKLVGPFFFMALYGLVTGPMNILLLVLSRHVLNRGAQGFGELISAFGIGMLISSLLLTVYRPKNIVSFVVGGYSLAGILFLAIGEVDSLPLDILLFAFWGAAVSIVNPLSQTLIGHTAPPHLLARVMTVMSIGFLLGIILGMLLFPTLIPRIGIPDVFETMGLTLLIPVFWIFARGFLKQRGSLGRTLSESDR